MHLFSARLCSDKSSNQMQNCYWRFYHHKTSSEAPTIYEKQAFSDHFLNQHLKVHIFMCYYITELVSAS